MCLGAATLCCACRYGFDADNKLPAKPSAQAQDKVGIFSNRASNPVVQAASPDATEAILWEVSPALCCCAHDLGCSLWHPVIPAPPEG